MENHGVLEWKKILIFLSMIRLIINSLSITQSHMLEVVDKTQSYKSIIKEKNAQY
jgi:hypothetical protein